MKNASSPLQQLRIVFIAFCVAIGAVGLVVLVLSLRGVNENPMNVGPVAAVVAAYAMSSLLLPRVIEKPLDCASDETLTTSYRTRFFLRLAIAEGAALIGFAGVFLTNQGWVYALGAAFTAVGFARAAPTAANLATDQGKLRQSHCDRSLLAALVTPPTPG